VTDPDGKVIPFPGKDPGQLAEELAGQLLQQGQDPGALVAQLLGLGARRVGAVLPERRQPTLPPPKESTSRYVVRVDLNGARPPIWRRLELASDLNLAELHEVLQTAMGWTDSHLHHFVGGPVRDHTVLPFLTDFDEEEGDEGVNERDVRLDQVLVEVGDRLSYEYDFGDSWDHTIRLERIEEYDATTPRARLTGGRRACPPEDCGGIGGYGEILEALADPDHEDEQRRELLTWLGDEYDPDRFSAAETDELLQLSLSSLGGAPGVETQLASLGGGFGNSLRELVDRSSRAPKPLAVLIAAAELTLLDEPDAESKHRMVRPWLHLLSLVGAGVKLTAAGWLPPAFVSRIAADLDLLEPWMGRGNREEYTVPVRIIRESAMALGLLRKANGRLLPTKLGQRLGGDTEGLWRHVASSMPLGRKDFERDAGAIMLLTVCAGETPYQGIRRYGADLMWSAGWATGAGPVPEGAAIEFARPTWDALRVAGCGPRVLADEVVDEPLRQLARAALRSG
jgi:hypothetical protein